MDGEHQRPCWLQRARNAPNVSPLKSALVNRTPHTGLASLQGTPLAHPPLRPHLGSLYLFFSQFIQLFLAYQQFSVLPILSSFSFFTKI